MKNKIKIFPALIGYCLLLLRFHSSWAQQILLDEPTQAGEFNLFPNIMDDNRYYYISDKTRIALQGSGTPQFSLTLKIHNHV